MLSAEGLTLFTNSYRPSDSLHRTESSAALTPKKWRQDTGSGEALLIEKSGVQGAFQLLAEDSFLFKGLGEMCFLLRFAS